MPAGSKKGERRGGRTKGTPNKLTADVKAMILNALENKGGVDYLEKQAEEHPTAFMTLLGRVLPLQIGGDPDSPIVNKVMYEIVDNSDSD